MNQINPKKIKKAEIAVGIPSYNEADTISNVAKKIDKGLQKFFKDKATVIINVDNNSQDETKDIFLKTKTKTPKMYVSTSKNVRGKGYNIYNFFKKCSELKVKAAMITDADIKSSSPDWAKSLIAPIEKGYDLVTPLYKRHKYDGTITNFICYPFVYGVFGENIRQPIGGDMGFSDKFIEHLLNQKWHESDYRFGIDIFITANAIKGNFNITQSNLGRKSHNPSDSKLNFMFLEVVESLFRNLKASKKIWLNKEKNNQTKSISCIEAEAWSRVCYDMFFAYDVVKGKQKEQVLKNLRDLFFLRIDDFKKETRSLTNRQVEEKIVKQAKIFYKNRDYLIKKYK